MPRLAAAFFLLATLQAHAGDPVARCRAAANRSECAIAAGHAHPVKNIAFWRAALARPLEERIRVGPPELIEFLMLDNVAHDYPNIARAPKVEPGFLADVRRAFAELPDVVKRSLAPKLAGIYFIEDIGGTGFSDEIVDDRGDPVAGFIILDPTVLATRTANEWATWKDSSPFKPDPAWRLESVIEERDRDDRMHAIQYILLHELGHVVSIGANAHPRWSIPVTQFGPGESYSFFTQSWIVNGAKWESRFEDVLPQRKDVRFYFGAKLPGDAMLPVYRNLERTTFVTLYGATHFGDDFAEAFASYVHVVLLQRPYEVRILQDAKLVKRYGSCWREERCAAKKAWLERFLAARR